MKWMLLPFLRYAELDGRARRKEYWMFALLTAIVAAVLIPITVWDFDSAAGKTGPLGTVTIALLLIYFLAAALPSFAVTVRRLHDQERSGWFVLFALVPWLGWLIMLVLMCLPGTTGANRYGNDPKAAR